MRHVPVVPTLALPWRYRHVEAAWQATDPALRVRRSIEQPFYFVLERQCRRAPAINVAMRIRSDLHLQARDGYIHVGLMHPAFLDKPYHALGLLRTQGSDLWARRANGMTGAESFEAEEAYEAAWQQESRKRRRSQLFREIALEHFDRMQRHDGARISNAGIAPAGGLHVLRH